VYLHIKTESEAILFESQVPTIVALTKGCKSATVVYDLKDIPAGCGSAVLTPTVVVHALVRVSITEILLTRCLLIYFTQGQIDLDFELAKCEKKLDLARLNLEKIQKVESRPDYEETVPPNVRLLNEEKVG